MEVREAVLLKLKGNVALSHAVFFRHRHREETPLFHKDIQELWHSHTPRALIMAFRNAGKSTIAEEVLTLGACYRAFHNAIIVGSTEKRAVERLREVKNELQTNEALLAIFGDLQGPTWNEAEIICQNGVRISAVGRGQSLRGTKHQSYRPDFCFCDDIEEVEEGQVYTSEQAQETVRWFTATLLQALDRDARVRVNATPLSPHALPMRLRADPAWVSHVYPIEYPDPATGERVPTWRARFALPWIDEKRAYFERQGLATEYAQEYMCVAEDPARKIFTAGMFQIKPTIRTWQPTYAFYDPARTTKSTSATTGWAVWSWIGNRLIVWDGGAELWKPDEIIDHIFKTDEAYAPVLIGVERDGLEEFIMQPLRHEMLRRGYTIPVQGLKAPRGKLAFIESLQKWFAAGEVSLAKPLDILVSQFLGFPTGRIDAPNALAYAPVMRPGQVIYEDFSGANVVEDLPVRPRLPVWLALNATSGLTTAVTCQFYEGALHVLHDYVRDGDPGASLGDLVRAASLDTGASLTLCAPPSHYGPYNHIGLRGAVAKIPADLRHGAAEEVGRGEIRALLGRASRSLPALQVSSRARWTLNAFAAGYARPLDKRGQVALAALDNQYKVLMEGLEAFAGLLKAGIVEETDRPNVQRTPDGRRYISALPGRGVEQGLKVPG